MVLMIRHCEVKLRNTESVSQFSSYTSKCSVLTFLPAALAMTSGGAPNATN